MIFINFLEFLLINLIHYKKIFFFRKCLKLRKIPHNLFLFYFYLVYYLKSVSQLYTLIRWTVILQKWLILFIPKSGLRYIHLSKNENIKCYQLYKGHSPWWRVPSTFLFLLDVIKLIYIKIYNNSQLWLNK